mmetsp:Transcript_71345/g.111743  ORF Transcript_71345/g.111743 Transcript_71345/m.111743 type:complete len:334 (+) Transcript_71345:88-1089(+)
MARVRIFALAIAGIADAARIQTNAYLNRQQSSENQHNSQRLLTTDSSLRDAPLQHRKSTLAADEAKSSSEGEPQERQINHVARLEEKGSTDSGLRDASPARGQEGGGGGNVSRDRKFALANLTGGEKSSSESELQDHYAQHEERNVEETVPEDVHLTRLGISSFLESQIELVQKARGLPKRFWILAITVSFIAVIVCFCGILGRSMLEGSSCKSNGRSRYLLKGRVLYEWEQTSTNVTLYTKPPEGVQTTSLEVSIYPRHLKIGRRGKPPWMKEELFGVADSTQSTWEISEEGELVVCLYKGEAGLEWPCVIRAHHPDKKKRREKNSIETDLS